MPGTDLGSLFASYPAWRRTGCLAPHRVPGTDLGPLFASYPAWSRTGCLAPIWAQPRISPLGAGLLSMGSGLTPVPRNAIPNVWFSLVPKGWIGGGG